VLIEKSLPPGTSVRNAMIGERILSNSKTLRDYALVSGSTLQVTLVSMPVLFLASPCSAHQLSKRLGSWRLTTWGECGGGGVAKMVKIKKDHHSWEDAPAEAREIANALREATPDLESRRVCLTEHGLAGGAVVIISNATEDRRMSCLQALQIRKNARDCGSDIEMSDLHDEDQCWRDLHDEDGSDIEDQKAYVTWLKHKDEPGYCGNLWGLSTLRDADLKQHIHQSFNAAFEEINDDVGQLPPWQRKVLEEAQNASTKNIAATQVMAMRLDRHFKFDFGCGRSIDGEPLVHCAPVIYGGYTPDGSIVGILTTRAKNADNHNYCSDSEGEESEDEASEAESEDQGLEDEEE